MTKEESDTTGSSRPLTAKVVLSGEMTVRPIGETFGIRGLDAEKMGPEYEEMGDDAFSGTDLRRSTRTKRCVKLKKKVEELERENEILKNFRAFSSQGLARGSSSRRA